MRGGRRSLVSGCQPCPQGSRLDEVRERPLAVDLDHREKLSVARLEVGIAVDGDDLEVELRVGPSLAHDLERPRAEAAPRGRVHHDTRYGYRPRVVVASATRRTASP